MGIFLLTGLSACNDSNESEAEDNGMATTETMENTTTGTNNYFSEWDANRDSYLDADEYSGGFFKSWDKNNDNRLDENEWNTGYQEMGETGQSWADWDMDADGFLNEGEYRTGSDRVGWYNAWDSDRDSRLSEQEYNQGMGSRTNRND